MNDDRTVRDILEEAMGQDRCQIDIDDTLQLQQAQLLFLRSCMISLHSLCRLFNQIGENQEKAMNELTEKLNDGEDWKQGEDE